MNTVVVNGQSFSIKGDNISIVDGKIIVDGKDMTPDSKEIDIQINGNIKILDIDCCNSLHIVGDVGSVESANGDINIDGAVLGNIETTNGNVDCLDVSGLVTTTNGNIKYRKGLN